MPKIISFFICFSCVCYLHAQYSFSGYVNNDLWHNNVYLSIVEDYRKLSGVYAEQIIAKIKTDSTGYFQFTGNQLEPVNKIYRIHVDNCPENKQDVNHFNGHCNFSKEILFLATNKDSIQFPFSFDEQMFCLVNSKNAKSEVFVKIDSLKEDMSYAYAQFRSEANRKLNNKKWFETFQNYGEKLNEPLAELYIYAFLSDRSNRFYNYYLEDLESNPYYDDLLNRLTNKYPNSSYTKQYNMELNSDKFMILNDAEKSFNGNIIVYGLLVLSIIISVGLWHKLKKEKQKHQSKSVTQLTKQEQNILKLLLDDKTNKEIAETLFISLSTVKTHTNNIYKKLNIQSREDAKILFNN